MVAGHVGFGTAFDFIIHAFHMPLFFIVSGYLFDSSRTCRPFFVRKVKSLIVPYVVFGAINLGAWTLINVVWGDSPLSAVLEQVKKLCWINTNGDLPIAGALWFLSALFFAELAFFAVVRLSRTNAWACLVFSLCVSVAGLYLSSYSGIPYGIDTALVGVGLMGVGFLLRRLGLDMPDGLRCLLISIAFLVVGLVAAYSNSYVNMRAGTYGNFALFYVAAVGITLGLYGFATLAVGLRPMGKLEFIGRNSLVYVCLNQLVILVVREALALAGLSLPSLCSGVVALLCALCVLHLCALFIDRHLRWAVGRC